MGENSTQCKGKVYNSDWILYSELPGQWSAKTNGRRNEEKKKN